MTDKTRNTQPQPTAEAGGAEQRNPFAEAPEGKKMLTVVALCFAVFGSICQSVSLSVMLPVAAADIGGVEYYSLASTIASPFSVALMPLWGYLAARSPHMKLPLTIFSVSCGVLAIAMRCFTQSMGFMIFAMFFWSFVSPGLFVCGYSLIRDMYDRVKAGGYLGMLSTFMLVAQIAGPVGGGWLMDVFGWRSLNWALLVIMLIPTVMLCFSVKVSKEEVAHMARSGGKFDVAGTIALIIGLGGLIAWLSLGRNLLPFGGAESNILLAVTVVALAAMVLIIRKKGSEAIIPAPAMRDRNVLAFTLGNFFVQFSNMAVRFFLPTYVIYVMGCSAFESGLAVAMMSIIGIFISPKVGKYMGKTGSAKLVMMINGAGRVVFSLVLLAVFLWFPNIVAVCVVMFFCGIYNAVNGVNFSAGPQIMLKPEIRVQGNSVIQCGQNFGGGVGTAVYTMCIGIWGVAGGMQVAMVIASALGVAVCICAAFLKKEDSTV